MEITKEFIRKYHTANIEKTRERIRESVSVDNLIIHAINNIDELQKSANLLSKRLREWYGLYNPDFARALSDNQKFSEIIQKKSRKKLLDELGITRGQSMGCELDKQDLDEILLLAAQISSVFCLISSHERYLESLMKKCCPNMFAITGTLIGARLIEHAGSLKHLAGMTSSTVQLLGAEKALFRHMRTGARSPKHGLIIQHPIVAQVKKDDKGRAARALADKISIAVKVDYFKGDFIGDKLNKELKDKTCSL
ncbi:hypothetical protein JXB31_03320 [Candidatus Woesearchaeota archaeon]|nr:hypothetical protein [Candidatus Woesearchaeota archaeon]